MNHNEGRMEWLAHLATIGAGSSWAFATAAGVIIVWLASGVLFHYSDTWQLVINTGTTIVTFLMVFLIQRSQNKDLQAVQLKLDEIIAALDGASARLINVEDFSEEELAELHRRYERLARAAERTGKSTTSHSIEESKGHRQSRKARHKAPERKSAAQGHARP